MTDDEVLQILNLIEKSSFDFLQLEMGDLKLTVSKSGFGGSATAQPMPIAPTDPAASVRIEIKAEKESATKTDHPEAKARDAAAAEGTLPIVAPMVGTFYTTPEPGAPPFVELGARVEEDATVGLIEVMKVFNAVQCGVRGLIAEICVQNGQFVEYGQTLFLVRPEGVLHEQSPSG